MPESYIIPEGSKLTMRMVNELIELLDSVDIKLLRKQLRSLSFMLINENELTTDNQDFLKDLPAFFVFIDALEEELLKNDKLKNYINRET